MNNFFITSVFVCLVNVQLAVLAMDQQTILASAGVFRCKITMQICCLCSERGIRVKCQSEIRNQKVVDTPEGLKMLFDLITTLESGEIIEQQGVFDYTTTDMPFSVGLYQN